MVINGTIINRLLILKTGREGHSATGDEAKDK
jgi:hypothetical protein